MEVLSEKYIIIQKGPKININGKDIRAIKNEAKATKIFKPILVSESVRVSRILCKLKNKLYKVPLNVDTKPFKYSTAPIIQQT